MRNETLSSPFKIGRKSEKPELLDLSDLRLSLQMLVAVDLLPDNFTLGEVSKLLSTWGRDKIRGQLYALQEIGFLRLEGKSWIKAESRFWYWLSKLEEGIR
jgi:hypothetical protein